MTQTESVVKALAILGGKGQLKWITLIALNMKEVDWTNTKTPDASIRRIVRNTPERIIPLNNGWYQLAEYQTELENCHAIIKQKDEEIAKLRGVETAKQFVARFLDAITYLLKRNTTVVEELRKVLVHLGMKEEAEELDKWIDSKSLNNNFNFGAGSKNTIIAAPNNEQ